MAITSTDKDLDVVPIIGVFMVGTGVLFHLVVISTRSLGFILTSRGPSIVKFYDYGIWTVCDSDDDCESVLEWAERLDANSSKLQAGQAFAIMSFILANLITWSMCAYCFLEVLQKIKWINIIYMTSCMVTAIMFLIGVSLVYGEFDNIGDVSSDQGWGFTLSIVAFAMYFATPLIKLTMVCRQRFGKNVQPTSTNSVPDPTVSNSPGVLPM